MAVQVLKKIFCFLLFCLAYSCIQDLNIDMPETENQIVIDGWIEQDERAIVLLTATTDYEAAIDSSAYFDIVMTRAKVVIFTGGDSEIMILKKDQSYFPSILYKSNRIAGQAGETYRIEVYLNDDTISGTTTIPEPVTIDTAWYETETGQDSLGPIWLKWRDPAGKNYYRIQTKEQSDQRYIGAQISALDDKGFEASSFEYPIFRGFKSISDKLFDHRFKIGDTVSIKLSTVNQDEFQFWNDYDESLLSAGNPFATSGVNLHSNITNGLGNWTGYGSNSITVICK